MSKQARADGKHEAKYVTAWQFTDPTHGQMTDREAMHRRHLDKTMDIFSLASFQKRLRLAGKQRGCFVLATSVNKLVRHGLVLFVAPATGKKDGDDAPAFCRDPHFVPCIEPLLKQQDPERDVVFVCIIRECLQRVSASGQETTEEDGCSSTLALLVNASGVEHRATVLAARDMVRLSMNEHGHPQRRCIV